VGDKFNSFGDLDPSAFDAPQPEERIEEETARIPPKIALPPSNGTKGQTPTGDEEMRRQHASDLGAVIRKKKAEMRAVNSKLMDQSKELRQAKAEYQKVRQETEEAIASCPASRIQEIERRERLLDTDLEELISQRQLLEAERQSLSDRVNAVSEAEAQMDRFNEWKREYEQSVAKEEQEAESIVDRLNQKKLRRINQKKTELEKRELDLERCIKMHMAQRDKELKEMRSKRATFEREALEIEARWEELDQGAASLERRRSEVDLLKEEVSKRDTRIKELNTSCGSLRQQNRKLEGQNSKVGTLKIQVSDLRSRNDLLRKKIAELEVHARESAHEFKSLRNEDAADELESGCWDTGPLTRHWLIELETRGQLNLGEYACLDGEGPLSENVTSEVLGRHGFSVYAVPDEDVEVLVVGREGWSEEALESQVEAREGNTLKVYSQEMMLLALITGCDPFDEDEDLIREMGKGHPALEFLMGLDFKWPSVSCGTGEGIVITDAAWHENSPLTAMGYRVGYSGLDLLSRRGKLVQIVNNRIQFPGDFSAAEKRKWGSPRSVTRLEQVAVHMVRNISLFGSRPNYKVAVSEWREDLAWLKKTYYKKRMRFAWPDTHV
jgi:hypothetical protein